MGARIDGEQKTKLIFWTAGSRDYRGDDLHLFARRYGGCSYVEDYLPQKNADGFASVRKPASSMRCHHKLEAYLDAYIDAAGVTRDRKGPLFRAAIGKTRKLSQGRMSRKDVGCMVRRRAPDAGIETPICCHTFRATGITDYLRNGGRIELAQRMAGHANANITGLYDRRNDDISVGEVERIGI